MTARAPLLDVTFSGEVVEWRGPAPFVFLPVPLVYADAIRIAARSASYGWGVVPVEATVAGMTFETSLFPRQESYLLPLKLAVRRVTGVTMGDMVTARMRIYLPDP